MMDHFPDLTTLLPAAPARVLLLGGCDFTPELDAMGYELVGVADGTELAAGASRVDAAIWDGEDSGVDAVATVARLRQQLSDDGQVIVVMPLPAGVRVATRREGSLPSRREIRLREIVERLSEAGFAIRKDEDFLSRRPSGATISGRPSGVALSGWKVLVAKRDPFVIRSYRDGDEQAIQQLFRTSFHLDRDLDHWRWKYADSPWGEGKISLAASCPVGPPGDHKLAAHYGGYPIPIWCDDEHGRQTFLALQIGDTMTDPEVRNAGRGKAGLLARTVRHFFAAHRDGSFGFFYGFNTGPIQRFCRWFIGGSQDRPVRYLVRELEPAPAWKAGGYRVERIETVSPAWDRLFRRAAPSYRFLVQRDAQYVDWRYRQRPDARYVIFAAWRFRRLVGWSVFLRRDDHIAWGDALFHPRHLRVAEPILAAAIAEPELAGAQRIAAWFSGGPPGWDDQLAKLGFLTQPEPQGLGMIALADTEPEAFDKLGEMYTTMGDGDLF